MSMSLRDQLLAAGLINQKQARDAERQQQHQQRSQQQSKQKRRAPAEQAAPSKPTQAGSAGSAIAQNAAKQSVASQSVAMPSVAAHGAAAQSAKVARDLALNRQRQEKAEKKARAAQIKQLIDQNRVPRVESDDHYNFVDGNSIRFIAIDAAIRGRLMRGEVVIVRHEERYDLVPAAVAERIRERDERAIIKPAAAQSPPIDEAYKEFSVPDDLMW